jgi:phosphoribosylformimino-5-aminoimidazole carboxamide ribotide isomerase
VKRARSFQDQGASYLHVVDLDAAKDPRVNNRNIIRSIVEGVDIPVEVGGGVRSRDDVQELLRMGVNRCILGTIILKGGDLVESLVSEYGKRVVAGIDARDGMVRVSGWTEGSDISALELGKRVRDTGFSLIIYTDISRDGMLEGPNVEAIGAMVMQTGLSLIAAGGISSMKDLRMIKAMADSHIEGVIAGKAIYEGRISVQEACSFLQEV